MNKKLMALAVAGAVTAPGLAVAQVGSSPGVTLYGRLDETIMYERFTASGNGAVQELKKGDIYSPGNAMGVRGREDLGGGTSAWFQLETGVWPDARMETSAVTGNNWGGRNSAIGLTSGIGDVLLGNWDTPYKVTYGVWNSVNSGGFAAAGILMGNGDTTGALNNALCTNTVSNGTGTLVSSSANAVCVTESTANGTGFSRRINNSVQYWSPVMAGFQVKLMTALPTYQSPGNVQFANGLPKAKEYSANATWARGPLSVGVGYDLHQGLRPATTTTVNGAEVNPKDTGIQIGAKWNFGPGEIGAGYEQLEYKNNGTGATPAGAMKVPTWVVNGRWNVGPGAVWASYAKSDGGKSCATATTTIGSAACGVEVKMMGLGYDYVLSKRTKLYVAYNKIDNGFSNGVGSSYYYIAGPAANAGNGTSGGVAAGSDVITYGLGVQHTF